MYHPTECNIRERYVNYHVLFWENHKQFSTCFLRHQFSIHFSLSLSWEYFLFYRIYTTQLIQIYTTYILKLIFTVRIAYIFTNKIIWLNSKIYLTLSVSWKFSFELNVFATHIIKRKKENISVYRVKNSVCVCAMSDACVQYKV